MSDKSMACQLLTEVERDKLEAEEGKKKVGVLFLFIL